MNDLAQAILASAQRLGVNPVDLGTVISYETAGTFDPWKAGPTTQWGQHRGLIQWGEPQRQKYGVREGMPVAEQLQAAERYLTDAGVKPGMGLMDLYSAVNAGRVGRYNASDANNGGAPGTVADKVNNQMAAHKTKAAALLSGNFSPVEMAQQAPKLQGGGGTPAGLAMMFEPGTIAAVNPAPDLAALYAAQTAQAEGEKQAQAEAEQRRKQALFGGASPLESLYSLVNSAENRRVREGVRGPVMGLGIRG